jgi:hypothetical protein
VTSKSLFLFVRRSYPLSDDKLSRLIPSLPSFLSLVLDSSQNPRTTEQDTFPSRSSSFTPRISAFRPPSDADEEVDPSTAAFQGLLRPITSFQFSANASSHPINMHGCPSSSSEELSPDGEKHGTANFALALRGECSFAVKVKTAVRLGAKALIVGDDVEYPGETDEDGRKRTTLLTMYAPTAGAFASPSFSPAYRARTDPLLYARTTAGDPSSYNIPAIFVSRSTYLTLRDELVKSPVGIQILLTQEEGWEWYATQRTCSSSPLLSLIDILTHRFSGLLWTSFSSFSSFLRSLLFRH